MINLDYYFRTNIYELENILTRGLAFDCYKTVREFGFALYLTDKPNINLNDKPIILDIHLKNYDNILKVTNFQELLTEHLLPITATSVVNINVQSAPVTIAGITMSPGDIVALSAQTNISENGIYIIVGTGLPLERTVDIISYVNQNGRTIRLGEKYIQKFMLLNGYSGLKITSENLLVLYNTSNIKYIKVYENK